MGECRNRLEMKGTPSKTIVLTGIKPTGHIHLGNYLGTIRPALELVATHHAYFFVADYHGLTTVRNPEKLSRLIDETVTTWLALGLDPEHVVFYRQSAVPEIFELMWILACISAKGLLNRAHAYKAEVAANLGAGRDADADINIGLFNYPLLMSADILAFQADMIPVGRDQQQHVEIARDVAAAFNRLFGPVFKLPQTLIRETVQTITGLDGRKMSKTCGNEIPVLADPDTLKQLVLHILTDSRHPEEPKDPEQCNVFALYRHFAEFQDVADLRQHYLAGGVAYQTVKETLAGLLIDRFASARRRYHDLKVDRAQIGSILDQGAIKAREKARKTLALVRSAVGIEPKRNFQKFL